jgi:hypothetical protein
MVRKNEDGNILLIPLVLITLFFIGAAGFGYWAYGQYQDYKVNVDKKVAVANEKAVAAEDIKKDAQFAEVQKSPFKLYKGPESYGAIQINFPKTWSAYIDEGTVTSQGVNGFFYPNVVPSLTSQDSSFALRVQVLSQSYSTVLQGFSSFTTSKKGTVVPYALPKLPSVVGVRLDGEVVSRKQGAMVILPLRDKTLKVWTEAPSFLPDFNNNILPNFTFSP